MVEQFCDYTKTPPNHSLQNGYCCVINRLLYQKLKSWEIYEKVERFIGEADGVALPQTSCTDKMVGADGRTSSIVLTESCACVSQILATFPPGYFAGCSCGQWVLEDRDVSPGARTGLFIDHCDRFTDLAYLSYNTTHCKYKCHLLLNPWELG